MTKFLSFFLIASLLLVSCQSTTTIDNNLAEVSVTASATVMIEADTASFTISSESLGKSSEEARRESTRLINTAIDILVSEFGVDKKELVTNHMTSSPYYEWVDGKRELVGQMARGSVQVTISDLDSVGHMYDRLSSVDGLSVSSVYFSKKDTSADVSEARRLAVIEARKKAEDYASGLGLEVVKVISITDGAVLNNVRYNGVLLEEKAMMATGAVSDSSEYYRGDLSVSDTVSVVFGLR